MKINSVLSIEKIFVESFISRSSIFKKLHFYNSNIKIFKNYSNFISIKLKVFILVTLNILF
jgi:hypothetical protein